MNHNQKLGKKGEDMAVNYLRSLDYKIIERNWRFSHKEVDIIARDRDFLVFVEVKTRSSKAFGEPIEAVNIHKQNFLIDAAEDYVISHNLDLEVRFDVVSILIYKNRTELEHIQEAFNPIIS